MAEESFFVRPAEEKDVSEILRLLVEVNMVHHNIRPDLFKGPSTKYTEDEMKVMVHDTENPIFVCVDSDGKFYGYIMCQTEYVKESALRTGIKTLYIDDLCVDEVSRGHHVGERLYNFAVEHARKTHCYNVTLHVWGGNDAAEKFYYHMGMKPQFTCLETIL